LRNTAWILALAGLLLAGCGRQAPFEPPGRVPLVILALDTVRADHLGCYGHPFVETPNLDALASESILFENCSSAAPWTLPSFASAFTGLYPYHHGAVGGSRTRVLPAYGTLAEYLKAAGYQTRGYVGVTYLMEGMGVTRGIDSLEVYRKGKVTGRCLQYEDKVVKFLQEAPRGAPWYLLVHYFDAHAPYDPPPPFDRRYYHGDPHDPSHTGLENLRSSNNRAMVFRDIRQMYDWLDGVTDPEFAPAQYAAGVAYLDDRLGVVLDALRESGWLDKIVLVVMADHGEDLGEHSCWYTHSYPYQECLHVPLMIRLPGGKEGGRRVKDEVSLVDLVPTLGELLGLQLPGDLDGISLVKSFRGARLPSRIFQAEQGARNDRYVKALWDDRWRFQSYHLTGRSWVELYDRRRDRAETKNVAAEHPEIVRRFEEEMARRFPPQHPITQHAKGKTRPLPKEVRDRLRSLGYVH